MTARYAFPAGGITLCQGCHDDGLLQGHPIGRLVEPSGMPCDICGHPQVTPANLAMVRPARHTRDSDCTVIDDFCTACGALHGDPCHVCAGRGYHADGCSEVG